ncbi:MAG TPA: tyrosine-type recombinase/integrase, partial [Pyrinomonadaceae bacterium]|nr:tyrosine-type recombinase/integrase [Pyrinomonadaceae bacterium]
QHYNLASKNRRIEIRKLKTSGPNDPTLRSNRSKMAKNFYQYTGLGGQVLHGYQRRYKKHQLRKKGFLLKRDAEKDLRQAMDDIDALERGEIRVKPTTAQEAFEIYKREQDIRGQAKSYNYRANNESIYKVVRDFVQHFGPNRLIRDCKETDLREFYQILCFRSELHKNTAGSYMSRVQGMMKAAQERKADLATWRRPTLKVNRRTKYERRVVEPSEYATLVQTLQAPPRVRSHQNQHDARWRDAADTVQLLRMTGGRLNEVLRIKLSQFIWTMNRLRLDATKTENARDIPLWNPIREVVQQRIMDGLTDDEYLFPHARRESFDKQIGETVLEAALKAGLEYGQAYGFTLHSLRHTFITDMMDATNKDVKLVMSWSGHKSLESFQVYLHASQEGRILGAQRVDSVALFLRSFRGTGGTRGTERPPTTVVKSFKRK